MFVDLIVNERISFVVLEDGIAERIMLERLHDYENENLESYEKPHQYIFVD